MIFKQTICIEPL